MPVSIVTVNTLNRRDCKLTEVGHNRIRLWYNPKPHHLIQSLASPLVEVLRCASFVHPQSVAQGP